jgi:hypothetical protein
MVALTALLFWLLTDASLRVTETNVSLRGLRVADEASVREHLAGLERSPNVFRVRASEIVRDLHDLPEVSSAAATVTLPGHVSVFVEERQPIFTWSDGEAAWLVDREGLLFAPGPASADAPVDVAADATADAPVDVAADATAASVLDASLVDDSFRDLPLVEDGRLSEEAPGIGSHLPATDLAVMRQLLALTPELLGSRAQELVLRVDQYDGYVLSSDRGWQAVFGHYTPTLQPPETVPRQVQCLRWLLASRERQLERVRLAISEDGCGTFTEFGRPGQATTP